MSEKHLGIFEGRDLNRDVIISFNFGSLESSGYRLRYQRHIDTANRWTFEIFANYIRSTTHKQKQRCFSIAFRISFEYILFMQILIFQVRNLERNSFRHETLRTDSL